MGRLSFSWPRVEGEQGSLRFGTVQIIRELGLDDEEVRGQLKKALADKVVGMCVFR